MSTRADALRNTLDHLALDPGASEDRRYLVSMLRRLGYSDAEIEAQIGPLSGEPTRIIEVEYEGPAKGDAPADRPTSRETTFQVAQPDDGLSFRISDDDAPLGAGVEEVEATDLSGVESDLGDWGDDYEQGEREDYTRVDDTEGTDDFESFGGDDSGGSGSYSYDGSEDDVFRVSEPEEQLVEFKAIKRPDPALAAGWKEDRPAPKAAPRQAPAVWDEAPEEPEPQEPAAWADEPDEDAWAPAEETPWPETAPETAAEEEVKWAQPIEPGSEGPVEEETVAWPEEIFEAPAEESWEPAPEPMEETVEAPEPGAEPEWEAVAPVEEEAWPEAEAAPEAPPEQTWQDAEWADASAAPATPYVHGDYRLYTRQVNLSTGREQRIYFFAKNEPQSGEPCALPEGYEVIENDKTGLPFLRRQR